MASFKPNPPDAASLMTTARNFGNYDLAGAMADLIDNSISAGARTVSLLCDYGEGEPEVRILDDGCGMTPDELIAAMRPASANPQDERSPDDLGRFGWGLKSASFSQCRRLTVVSRKEGQLSGAAWDLDDIDDWKMEVFSESQARRVCSPDLCGRDGTEVIWQRCDRLSEDGSLQRTEFNDLITHARNKLALVFHRYLAGEVGRRRFEIRLNGTPIPEYDPFHREHEATQQLEVEVLPMPGGESVKIQPFILPHFGKLKKSEVDKLAGDEGFLKNQGFYIYRSDRLILHGTWFRLVQFGELAQLIRVSIDIPNSMDSEWRLTIDKSDAQLPSALRKRLRQLVASFKSRSTRVFRARGGKLPARNSATPLWNRYAKGGEIRYAINPEHPMVEALYHAEGDERDGAVRAALRAIENGFPVSALEADMKNNSDAVHQVIASMDEFRDFVRSALPALLSQQGGDMNALVQRLKLTEPFSSHWEVVEELLKEDGWL